MSIKQIILGAAALAGVALPLSAADAAVTININQSGSDVIATALGTLNLTGLTPDNSTLYALSVSIRPQVGYVGLGTDNDSVRGYTGFLGPANFGVTDLTGASSGSGTDFAFNASAFAGIPYVFVPDSYVSGSAISSTATWLGASLASLGAVPGTYVYTSANDTITINIGAVVPEISTWAMMLVGFAGIGLAMRRRRVRELAIA